WPHHRPQGGQLAFAPLRGTGRTGPEVGSMPGDQDGEIGGAHGSILSSFWWIRSPRLGSSAKVRRSKYVVAPGRSSPRVRFGEAWCGSSLAPRRPGLRIHALAHVLRIMRRGIQDRCPELRVLLHERGQERVEESEHVVADQNLAVAVRARADADRGDFQRIERPEWVKRAVSTRWARRRSSARCDSSSVRNRLRTHRSPARIPSTYCPGAGRRREG